MIRWNLFFSKVFLEKCSPLDRPSLFLVPVRKLTVSAHGRAALQWRGNYKFIPSGTSRNACVHLVYVAGWVDEEINVLGHCSYT